MPTKKSVRVRARFHLPPKSPPFAVHHVAQPIYDAAPVDCYLSSPVNEPTRNNIQSQVLETSSNIGKDGNCDDLAPNTSGNVVVPDMRSHILPPQKVQKQEDFLKMDLIEQEICIKCDKGGKLLICSESGCLIAVHENCMGCLPRFDDVGNFCCPYCLYRQATAETCAARERALLAEKALLIYMDKEKNKDNQNKQKTGTAKGKEPASSTAAGNLRCGESENRMKSNNIRNQSAQLEKTPNGVAAVCTTNTSPSKETDTPILNEKDDGCRDQHGQSHSDQRMLVEHRTHPEVMIAYADGVSSREEGKSHQFETLEVGNIVKVEYHEEVDDFQCERPIEYLQQAGYSRASHVEGEITLSDAVDLSGKGKRKNAEAQEVNGGKIIKEEPMQEHVQETTLALTVPEPSFLVHEEFDIDLETTSSIVEEYENVAILRRHLKDKYKQSVHSQSVDLPRRLLPLELVTSEAKSDKILCIKSRQIKDPSKPISNVPCGGGRRIKWRREEEEILKAGVEKYSHMINKNLPWKKILDFGRGVFDVSRTPADLKGKWRNILAKQHSMK